MVKGLVTISVENQVIEKARKEGINISQAAEEGLINKCNIKTERKEYSSELAETYPDEYWINPATGFCELRGAPLFFVNEFGKVRQITKAIYEARKKKERLEGYQIQKKKPKLGDIYFHNEQIPKGTQV